MPKSLADLDERFLFRFLREVPFLPEARDLGLHTAPVEPWPHQLRVVRRAVERYPQSLLFADEVGLGKTVEAALALRQLVLSGRVRRALLLVPKSVLRQWQEELYEKAALQVPRYERGRLVDVFGRDVTPELPKKTRTTQTTPWSTALWNAAQWVLVSSQTAKRRDRRAALLAAEPWDLVLVDEAHHARRRDFRAGHNRPNRLLELLAGHGTEKGLKDRARCIYLLTATPMQVHPVEVWDLLKILGLGGLWGAREENFLRFFEELRKPPRQRDEAFLRAMLRDRTGDQHEESAISPEQLADEAWLRRHTPLADLVERHQRSLLRRYQAAGLLDATVSERRPENAWIEMAPRERRLYERIEAYLAEFYRRFEDQRAGLGFVMTVYRRRLTSSFAAVRQSLARRRRQLEHVGEEGESRKGKTRREVTRQRELGFEPGDLEEVELERDAFELAPPAASEAEYLDAFLADLAALETDSKTRRLLEDLEKLLEERETVLVFTQYTDTMDALREELRAVHGATVACYSGRGGETWDDGAWRPASKETLKEAFRRAEIRVLLATEAASEGLNLQTCGVLINFDMPWNPMRVEQRIGRLDRIGQRHAEVWIRNYFYADTVEAVIYQRLSERIRFFEEVLGRLQPILHRVGETIERVAMLGRSRRARALEEELAALGHQAEESAAFDVGLDDSLGRPLPAPADVLPPPVRLAELAAALLGSQALGSHFKPASEPGVYQLAWRGKKHRVTFEPEVFDRHPSTVELLTWGHPLLDDLLGAAGEPPASDEPTGLALYRGRRPVPLSLFLLPRERGVTRIRSLEELATALESDAGRWPGSAESAAATFFSAQRQKLARPHRDVLERRRAAAERGLAAAAATLLRRAALLSLAVKRGPGLFDDEPVPRFGRDAVEALAGRGAPWADLLRLAAGEDLEARSDDPYFYQLAGRSPEDLERRARALAAEGRAVAARHATLDASLLTRVPAASEGGGLIERLWFPLAATAKEETGDGDELPFRLVSAGELEPFANAVPLYDDLGEAARRFAAGDRQGEEEQNPADWQWAELSGRTVPRPGLFVARIPGTAIERRAPAGAWAVFRLAPRELRGGEVVLARHREIDDPDLGIGVTLRLYESAVELRDGVPRHRVILRPASADPAHPILEIDDPEEEDLRVVAVMVEVLG